VNVGGGRRNKNRNRSGGPKNQGAAREQKQRQQATVAGARAVKAARGKTGRDRSTIIAAAIVLVVVALIVTAGVLYEQHKKDQAAQTVIPVQTVTDSSKYTATIDKVNATVLVGKPDAKVTVDAYEDFLCPVCNQFETANFGYIAQQLAAGTVKVRYHMINLLDVNSNPAGYSLMSANTALAVATVAPDKFIDYHYSLYKDQPQEDGPGWTQAQLTSLANRLGASGGEFDNLVNSKAYNNQIQTNMNNANKDQTLFQTAANGNKGFGTPTIVVNNKVINWQADTKWLSTLVSAAYPNPN
jgi:protein-disulfide isomerase